MSFYGNFPRQICIQCRVPDRTTSFNANVRFDDYNGAATTWLQFLSLWPELTQDVKQITKLQD